MSEPDSDRPQGQLFEEAAAWFARMRGPEAEASRGEFEAWLARGALHRSAYNRAAEIFAMGKLLQDDGEDAPPARRRTRKRMLAALALAAACLLAAAWILLGQAGETWRGGGKDEGRRRSGTGSIELASPAHSGAAYRLNDGSLVTLAAATRLRIDFTNKARLLRLAAGEGRFRVAHELRPFVVYAGGGSVTARGTVFDVALTKEGRVSVRLIEGVIDVAEPGSAPKPRSHRLVAGQSTSFAASIASSGAARQPQSTVKGDRAAGAPREYDGARLGDLIDEANRRSKRPIRLSGKIPERRVSGWFRIDDTELLADRIAALFDLAVDRSNPDFILLRPR